MTPAERPILFSSAMVRAILDGRKTMTRRIIKPQPIDDCQIGRPDSWKWGGRHTQAEALTRLMEKKHPFGQRLWVREAFSVSGNGYFYRADIKQPETVNYSWTPSIHMPREASRLILEITGVRVERLQQIADSDAADEGAEQIGDNDGAFRKGFEYLWDSINAKRDGGIYAWGKNPWIWVISFNARTRFATCGHSGQQ